LWSGIAVGGYLLASTLLTARHCAQPLLPNSAPITIACMFILSGLERTGCVDGLGKRGG